MKAIFALLALLLVIMTLYLVTGTTAGLAVGAIQSPGLQKTIELTTVMLLAGLLLGMLHKWVARPIITLYLLVGAAQVVTALRFSGDLEELQADPVATSLLVVLFTAGLIGGYTTGQQVTKCIRTRERGVH